MKNRRVVFQKTQRVFEIRRVDFEKDNVFAKSDVSIFANTSSFDDPIDRELRTQMFFEMRFGESSQYNAL